MKLSELKGEHAIEVIADLIAPITNIVSNPENKSWRLVERREGETDREMAARELRVKVPKLLRSNKKDVLDILCTINGKSPEEMSLFDITKGTIELFDDEDFISLFMYAVNTVGGIQPTESSVTADHSEPES